MMAMLVCQFVSAQAYRNIRLAPLEYNTHNSHSGITLTSIAYQSTSGSYLVDLFNGNHNDPYDGTEYRTSYSFEWYLSYKGKRVSDYVKSIVRCLDSEQKIVFAWPNEVPKGYEKYVTVQFGREPIKKDRRDDD